MPVSAKDFAKKLNSCLDSIDAPVGIRERAAILSKMLEIPKQQAWSLIEGQAAPNEELLKKIVTEFEVDFTWLTSEK